eukprot:gnl/Chilomastix_cuspidata/107.p1 GENE.gnl/Chilomastix_cuspidata/107~~gnl/Chilomastix_cuspidata/107.p1  ORF type:complete len:1270 (+),score=274.63 gnl/Chilomastix_cuspidata/107:34-3843(+)
MTLLLFFLLGLALGAPTLVPYSSSDHESKTIDAYISSGSASSLQKLMLWAKENDEFVTYSSSNANYCNDTFGEIDLIDTPTNEEVSLISALPNFPETSEVDGNVVCTYKFRIALANNSNLPPMSDPRETSTSRVLELTNTEPFELFMDYDVSPSNIYVYTSLDDTETSLFDIESWPITSPLPLTVDLFFPNGKQLTGLLQEPPSWLDSIISFFTSGDSGSIPTFIEPLYDWAMSEFSDFAMEDIPDYVTFNLTICDIDENNNDINCVTTNDVNDIADKIESKFTYTIPEFSDLNSMLEDFPPTATITALSPIHLSTGIWIYDPTMNEQLYWGDIDIKFLDKGKLSISGTPTISYDDSLDAFVLEASFDNDITLAKTTASGVLNPSVDGTCSKGSTSSSIKCTLENIDLSESYVLQSTAIYMVTDNNETVYLSENADVTLDTTAYDSVTKDIAFSYSIPVANTLSKAPTADQCSISAISIASIEGSWEGTANSKISYEFFITEEGGEPTSLASGKSAKSIKATIPQDMIEVLNSGSTFVITCNLTFPGDNVVSKKSYFKTKEFVTTSELTISSVIPSSNNIYSKPGETLSFSVSVKDQISCDNDLSSSWKVNSTVVKNDVLEYEYKIPDDVTQFDVTFDLYGKTKKWIIYVVNNPPSIVARDGSTKYEGYYPVEKMFSLGFDFDFVDLEQDTVSVSKDGTPIDESKYSLENDGIVFENGLTVDGNEVTHYVVSYTSSLEDYSQTVTYDVHIVPPPTVADCVFDNADLNFKAGTDTVQVTCDPFTPKYGYDAMTYIVTLKNSADESTYKLPKKNSPSFGFVPTSEGNFTVEVVGKDVFNSKSQSVSVTLGTDYTIVISALSSEDISSLVDDLEDLDESVQVEVGTAVLNAIDEDMEDNDVSNAISKSVNAISENSKDIDISTDVASSVMTTFNNNVDKISASEKKEVATNVLNIAISSILAAAKNGDEFSDSISDDIINSLENVLDEFDESEILESLSDTNKAILSAISVGDTQSQTTNNIKNTLMKEVARILDDEESGSSVRAGRVAVAGSTSTDSASYALAEKSGSQAKGFSITVTPVDDSAIPTVSSFRTRSMGDNSAVNQYLDWKTAVSDYVLDELTTLALYDSNSDRSTIPSGSVFEATFNVPSDYQNLPIYSDLSVDKLPSCSEAPCSDISYLECSLRSDVGVFVNSFETDSCTTTSESSTTITCACSGTGSIGVFVTTVEVTPRDESTIFNSEAFWIGLGGGVLVIAGVALTIIFCVRKRANKN